MGCVARFRIAAAPQAVFLGVDTDYDLPKFFHLQIPITDSRFAGATPVIAMGNGNQITDHSECGKAVPPLAIGTNRFDCIYELLGLLNGVVESEGAAHTGT